MQYIKVLSTIDGGSQLFFYMEVDEQYFEKRKIEIVDDGLLGYANENFSFRDTILDTNPVLSIPEINEVPGMQAWEIDQQEFEHYWKEAISVVAGKN